MKKALLKLCIIFTVLAAVCFGNDISGFHDYAVGDSLVYYCYRCRFTDDDIGEYERKSYRTHYVDSINKNGDTRIYFIRFEEVGKIIEWKNGMPSTTTPFDTTGSASFIVVKDSLKTKSDFFPYKSSFTEGELTRVHSFGVKNYNNQERNYLKYQYFEGGVGGLSGIKYYTYLSGFGTIYRLYGTDYQYNHSEQEIQLVRYNTVIINPDSLDSLMYDPTSNDPTASVKKHYSINSLNSLHALFSNATKEPFQKCAIDLYNVSGRKITTVRNIGHLKLHFKEIPSGTYIISGSLGCVPFCFRENILK